MSRRELEHMLDLSTKNVVLAVRYYQPLSAPLSSSACSPRTASSSACPVPSSASYPTAAMSPPAVAFVYPASPSTTTSEGNTASGVSADPTTDSLHVDVEKNKASDFTGNRGEGEGQGLRKGDREDAGGRTDDFSPLKDDLNRSPKKDTARPPVLPVQRIILSTEDLVLSFGRAGRRRRRVLGR